MPTVMPADGVLAKLGRRMDAEVVGERVAESKPASPSFAIHSRHVIIRGSSPRRLSGADQFQFVGWRSVHLRRSRRYLHVDGTVVDVVVRSAGVEQLVARQHHARARNRAGIRHWTGRRARHQAGQPARTPTNHSTGRRRIAWRGATVERAASLARSTTTAQHRRCARQRIRPAD